MDIGDAREEEGLLPAGHKSPTRSRAWDTHVLSFAFWFVFLAYGAVQNMESSVNSEGDLGTVSLGVLYLSFTFFSLFASPLVRILSPKRALVLGTTRTELTKYIVTPTLGVAGVGGAMAVFGAADALCSWVVGRLTSGLSSSTWIVSGGAFIQGFVLFWILLKNSVPTGVLATVYPLAIAVLWGIGDGVFNTQLNAILGILFKHDTEAAFAQLKVWQSGAIAVVVFLSPHISLHAMLWVMIVALCSSLAAFLVLAIFVEKVFLSES